jgi:hypothetical protein
MPDLPDASGQVYDCCGVFRIPFRSVPPLGMKINRVIFVFRRCKRFLVLLVVMGVGVQVLIKMFVDQSERVDSNVISGLLPLSPDEAIKVHQMEQKKKSNNVSHQNISSEINLERDNKTLSEASERKDTPMKSFAILNDNKTFFHANRSALYPSLEDDRIMNQAEWQLVKSPGHNFTINIVRASMFSWDEPEFSKGQRDRERKLYSWLHFRLLRVSHLQELYCADS